MQPDGQNKKARTASINSAVLVQQYEDNNINMAEDRDRDSSSDSSSDDEDSNNEEEENETQTDINESEETETDINESEETETEIQEKEAHDDRWANMNFYQSKGKNVKPKNIRTGRYYWLLSSFPTCNKIFMNCFNKLI